MSGGSVLDPRTAEPFPIAAAVAVRNTQMRKNVRHATEVIQTKRARVVAERADWEALRESGKRLRDHAIRNMDAYLLEFERNCTLAGGTVHWARDAAEARAIVVKLAQDAIAAGSVAPPNRWLFCRPRCRNLAGRPRSQRCGDARGGAEDQIHDDRRDSVESSS